MTCPRHPEWRFRAVDCPFCEPDDRIITGGQYYERTPEGLRPVGATPAGPHVVELWICRRVADYPGGRLPAGGALAFCAHCREPIAFNPARTVEAPKVCMQCARIQPLPFE